MSFWSSRRVVGSGGNGFLGSVVVDKLRAAGCREIAAPRSSEYDLREWLKCCDFIGMRAVPFLFILRRL